MTSSIKCLILSDTHNEWPYSDENPAPKVDVFIHCGDLTQYGGLPSFQRAVQNINSVDAELKLFIAGNHDVDIDPVWLHKFAEDEDDFEVGSKSLSMLKYQTENGTHYLEEGTYAFTLKDGRSFTVYATPYTPEFGEFAFLYGEEEDLFNKGANAVPENVDIDISHGPPAFPTITMYSLDTNRDGKHCGCEKLARALQRARPKLCCFGHIHEGRWSTRIDWAAGTSEPLAVGVDEVHVPHPCKEGRTETVLVNAAVHGDRKGWLVNLDLQGQ